MKYKKMRRYHDERRIDLWLKIGDLHTITTVLKTKKSRWKTIANTTIDTGDTGRRLKNG